MVQIPSLEGFSWEEMAEEHGKLKMLDIIRADADTKSIQDVGIWEAKRSLGSWEIKASLIAKAELNFQQNKLDNVADTIGGEADITSIRDVESCKNKRSLGSWETKRSLITKTKLHFQWNWRAIQTTWIEQRLKSTQAGGPRADSANQRRRPTRSGVPTGLNAEASKNASATLLWVDRCCLFQVCSPFAFKSKHAYFGCLDPKIMAI